MSLVFLLEQINIKQKKSNTNTHIINIMRFFLRQISTFTWRSQQTCHRLGILIPAKHLQPPHVQNQLWYYAALSRIYYLLPWGERSGSASFPTHNPQPHFSSKYYRNATRNLATNLLFVGFWVVVRPFLFVITEFFWRLFLMVSRHLIEFFCWGTCSLRTPACTRSTRLKRWFPPQLSMQTVCVMLCMKRI